MNNGFSRPTRRFFSTAGIVVVAALVLQACDQSSPGAEPVAVWDGGKLERHQYETWIDRQKLEPSRESIRRLALIMSMAEDARKRGMENSAEVALAAEAMRQATLLPALKQHIDAQVSIPEEQIDQLVATYPDAFQQPRKLFLRGIYKRLPSDEAERAAVRKRMQELRAQVVDGVDIKQLAARESESQSRYRDGSIGFVDPARLPSPVGKAVEGLAIGDVSPLIEHADGLSFYLCERVKPESIPDADEVRHKFRQNLFRQRSAELNKALLEQLAERIRIRLDEDPVLRAGRHELPAGWLDDLVGQRLPDRDPAALNDRQKRRLLHEWGLRVAMSDHAESLGLGGPEASATAMHWHRIYALATIELRYQVDSRLRPPSGNELEELYRQRQDRLRNPIGLRIAAIQFANAKDLKRREVVGRARETVARIRAGELDFTQAARDFSIHASAGNGGLLGWMAPRELGGLDVSLVKPVRQLTPGEDTGLLRLESGLWVVKLLEQRPATPMTFDQARGQLEEVFRQQQIQRLEAEVREQHLADINLRILAY